MFRVLCDHCGNSASGDTDYYAWVDADDARSQAEDAGWRFIDGKDLCPECWEWDEEADEAKAKS